MRLFVARGLLGADQAVSRGAVEHRHNLFERFLGGGLSALAIAATVALI